MTTEDLATGFFLEAHFVHGLAPLVSQELRQRLKRKFKQFAASQPDTIRFALIDDRDTLTKVRTVTAFYMGRHYAIPRPKALLGNAHFQQLITQLTLVRHTDRNRAFRTFRIEAAGSESSIFRRLRQQIATATGLIDDPESGELVIRVFPTFKPAFEPTFERVRQWTVLCRLTPRPLSARTWRVSDFPGALNATIAASMIRLSKPQPTDRLLNLMCGSGTLIVERLLIEGALVAIGCDTSVNALESASQNINAAGLSSQVVLMHEDATRLPFPAQSFDVLVADFPWGHLIGNHAENQKMYPRLLIEAARVALPQARLVLITSEVRLFEQTLQTHAHLWQLQEMLKLDFKNLRPRIYVLQRTTLEASS